jgi:hypothetical protein
MRKLSTRFYSVNWRVVVAVTSLLAFAIAGSADDPTPW